MTDDMKAAATKDAANVVKLTEAIRSARALADHVIHGEHKLADIESIHRVLTDALRLVDPKSVTPTRETADSN